MSVAGAKTFTPQYPATRPTLWPQTPASPRPDFTALYPVTCPTLRLQAPASARPGFGASQVVPKPVKTAVVTPRPVRPDSVKVFCGERSVQVEAQMDLLGIGQVIQLSDITLGGCGPTGQDSSAQVLVFEIELQGCGSTLTMTEDSLIYAFALIYEPKALGATPIIRNNGDQLWSALSATTLHNVSSNALKPTWIPYHSTMSAEELLVFTP
ncbi:hypothetical protein AAFF_G00067140 [Aldrovandia affinis]|uniref:ZP domain-containing protein n=1 Tax=Aldrovandia affinis TaxID=143900 RepID=A0AAD7WY96_9TELE|nr:hypothetical protein AAFF_G00067140 [Aldrovandia affinis]